MNIKSNNVLLFSPSSELEKPFIQSLYDRLNLDAVNLIFVTCEFYKQQSKTFNFGFPFQIRLNYDLYLTQITYQKLNKNTSNQSSEFNYLKNIWYNDLQNVKQENINEVNLRLKSLINIFNPFLIIVWGDHRPFSLACVDIAKTSNTPFFRIDRGFIPNSYRLYKEAFSQSIAISEAHGEKSIEVLALLERFKSSLKFTYNNSDVTTISSNQNYALFLAPNDIDVGIYEGSRYLNDISTSFTSSFEAYCYIKDYLIEKYSIDCLYRAHPYSPYKHLSNANGDLKELIENAKFIVGMPTGPLFHASLLNKQVLCIGYQSKTTKTPFIQLDNKNEITDTLDKMLADKNYAIPTLKDIAEYMYINMIITPSEKNNNIRLNNDNLNDYILNYRKNKSENLFLKFYYKIMLFIAKKLIILK